MNTNPKTNLKTKTCLCIDGGTFLPFAQKLAEGFDSVFYSTPMPYPGTPALRDYLPGLDVPGIEHVDDFWGVLNEVDVVVFPDIGQSGLQEHVATLKPVWGARGADVLETQRQRLLNTMEDLRLDMPTYEVCEGLSELRDYLKEHDNKFIKVSRIRRDFETFHHINYALSQPRLDALAMALGPMQESVSFIVMAPVEGIETAIDTYTVDGEWPQTAVHGLEIKDTGYLCAVQPYSEMPEQLRHINASLSPALKDYNCRQMFAAEARINDKQAVLMDVSTRHTSPAGECLLELYDNWPEIVWAGAHGELVEPEVEFKYGVQLMIEHKGEADQWRTLVVPLDVAPLVKLYNVSQEDDLTIIPPSPTGCAIIGSIVGMGDSWGDALDMLKGALADLNDQPIIANTAALVDGLRELQEAQADGLKFGNGKVPDESRAL